MAIAAVAFLLAFAIDVGLFISTANEGFSYVSYVWGLDAPWVCLWAVLFAGWQLAPLATMVMAGTRR